MSIISFKVALDGPLIINALLYYNILFLDLSLVHRK